MTVKGIYKMIKHFLIQIIFKTLMILKLKKIFQKKIMIKTLQIQKIRKIAKLTIKSNK